DKKQKKWKKWIFPALTIAMIAFIWGHSMMPADISSDESGWVSNILGFLFRLDGRDIEGMVRKCAHFLEYMVLGILLTIDTCVLLKRPFAVSSLAIGLFVPLVDETIQLFTLGRSGSIFDIWLDFCGFVTGIICSVIIYHIIKK
ncbi:MAG: VanZ family protein, partial [Firmicutes bacterium]|nr:VanZ family protein [Bacillota bacterium]